ncbi:hypothetical protein HBA55_34600 [Pseudomaricurvus alkylphenolicus]|uniref:hypothetical protein n=1 Tax=Pseudomaricurvus alkylphenolicus TaxID=1306991 RepID=UPI00141F63BC|nr:hypothetical protein [Pseudomaricurvus alkylphenolicus]NIB44762.1 hypothetical protein [Pseudomaricurvus alkylphenolicus]
MDADIKRIVERQFPELTGRYHLPHFARIESISDPVVEPGLSEDFRPRYAVDIVVLTETGEPNPELPLYRSVPLPISGAGMERGGYGFPEPGTLVEVAFAYGLPHKPFIRTVLPHGVGLPAVEPGEQLHQSATGVEERTSANGDKLRSTHGNITDQATRYYLDALSSLVTLQQQMASVAGHSTEEVGGIKTIEALGALKLLSGGHLNLSAVDNLNITTASDVNETVGRKKTSKAKNNQHIEVAAGGNLWLGSTSVNVLQLLSELMGIVKQLADDLAGHTHGGIYPGGGTTQAPGNAGDFSSASSNTNGIKGQLDPIVE